MIEFVVWSKDREDYENREFRILNMGSEPPFLCFAPIFLPINTLTGEAE